MVGGVAGRNGGPGDIAAYFPEDGVEDRTGIEGRTAAGELGGVVVEERLDKSPLLVGEIQKIIRPARTVWDKLFSANYANLREFLSTFF